MCNPKKASPSRDYSDLKNSSVVISAPCPIIHQTDLASVRAYLKQYGQYYRASAVVARAKQLQSAEGSTTTTTNAVLLMQIKYCVDAQQFTLLIDLGFIDNFKLFDDMTDDQLQAYPHSEAKDSKEVVALEGFDELIEKKLKMHMNNRNSKSRRQELFANYYSVLSRQGAKWIIKKSRKLAAIHDLSSICPKSLKKRLEFNMSISNHVLQKVFKEFLKHALKLSRACQFLDPGSKKKTKKNEDRHLGNPEGNTPNKDMDKDLEMPVCFWESHCKTGGIHLLRHCKECPFEQKTRFLANSG